MTAFDPIPGGPLTAPLVARSRAAGTTVVLREHDPRDAYQLTVTARWAGRHTADLWLDISSAMASGHQERPADSGRYGGGMIESGDSNWVRVGAYLVVAALTLVALLRESHRAAEVDGVWRPFWPLTGGLLAVMAIGRAGGVGDLVTGLARDEVVGRGWYESRRPVQAVVVGAVGLAWLIPVSVACCRPPERRRRYLPMGLAIVTLAVFAAIRLVSLHQVDTLLHRRHIAGVRVGTLTELGLLLLAGIMTLRIPAGRSSPTASLVAPDGGALES